MTTERRDKTHQTPFGRWLQEHPELDSCRLNLSVTDSDMWVHKYKLRDEKGVARRGIDCLMSLEIKCFEKDVPYAQRDTLNVVDDLIRRCSTKRDRRYPIKLNDRRSDRPGVYRFVRWFGVHVLQLSQDRPDNSEQILWDGKEITEAMLIEMLKFERDPDHPQKALDTRRHHKRPLREAHPSLFSTITDARN